MVRKLRPEKGNKRNYKQNVQEIQKTSPRPIVTLPVASLSQETTTMSLRHHQGYTFLYVINMCTC